MAYDARLAFARNLSRGESCVDLALAALQIAAEDDAIGEGMNLKSKESFLNSVSCGRGFICDKSGRGFQISLFYRGCFKTDGPISARGGRSDYFFRIGDRQVLSC